MNRLSTFAIYTLGCKVNLYESNLVKNNLILNGLLEVPFTEKADIYIINTCSVTSSADAKSRNIINRPKRINKNSIVVVMGCFSQTNKDECKNLDADIIIGNKYKNNIYSIICEYAEKKEKIVRIDNLLLEKDFESSEIDSFKDNTRAFIKIQDGCNFMCSYCIIPYSRGRQRSKPMTDVVNETQKLVKNGYKEIVLTGVNTAGFLDNNGNNFYDLLCSLSNLDGDFRIRISSVEPFQITNEIVDLITLNKKRFCQHWHICLQSGSDKVLESMNRKYYTENFLDLISNIRKKSPKTTFTTDYIVGFPTETEQEHEISKKFLNKISFFDIHIFPYSERKGTAASMLKQISPKIKQKRFEEIKDIAINNKMKILDSFINDELDVLFETNNNSDIWMGHSSEYIRVHVKSNDNLKNKLKKIKIKKRIGEILIGEIIGN